ncbi:hypothetical protein SGP15_24735 [Brenneria sp. L4-2C]|uniref:hypothetical protein n=2 Tax=unclassified Brenneria TaxID=2634434 RepID=UPI0029C5CD77|nr:hypothetical protein [Brenneria sp. L4-2C]MDX5698223.1 hypothetical protein [Brenneria sp. L4-2C]
MTLDEFTRSDYYISYLHELESAILKKIHILEMEPVLMKIYNRYIDAAGISAEDLKWVIENRRKQSIFFIKNKYMTYFEADGGEDNIVNEPLKLNFPIGHLIEFFLILDKPEKLIEYIKSIRIPNAKKYAKEITSIFNKAQGIA